MAGYKAHWLAILLVVAVSACSTMPMRVEVIDLQIFADSTFFWNGERISSEMLTQYLEAAALKTPQPEIHLRPDRQVKYDSVARLLAEVQRSGLHNVGFVGVVGSE